MCNCACKTDRDGETEDERGVMEVTFASFKSYTQSYVNNACLVSVQHWHEETNEHKEFFFLLCVDFFVVVVAIAVVVAVDQDIYMETYGV